MKDCPICGIPEDHLQQLASPDGNPYLLCVGCSMQLLDFLIDAVNETQFEEARQGCYARRGRKLLT